MKNILKLHIHGGKNTNIIGIKHHQIGDINLKNIDYIIQGWKE